MRDLEIRGAGNILGTAQSGHILAIGFDLYCQLLKQAIAKLKGEKVKPRIETVLHLDFIATNEADFVMAKPAPPGEVSAPDIHQSSSDIRHFPPAPAFLPVSYIENPQTRIQAYRSLAGIGTQQQLDQLRKAWRDRFGVLPAAVENLLLHAEIKLAAAVRKVTKLEVKDGKIMLTRGGDYVLINGKFPRLTAETPTMRLHELAALIKSF